MPTTAIVSADCVAPTWVAATANKPIERQPEHKEKCRGQSLNSKNADFSKKDWRQTFPLPNLLCFLSLINQMKPVQVVPEQNVWW